MGFTDLFGGAGEKELVTHQETRNYGEAEAAALQPGMFNAWQGLRSSGGVPYGAELDAFVKDAYARAAAGAGATAPGAAGAAIGSDIGKRGGIAGDLLMGATGVQGRQNLTNMAGQAAGYASDLTSDRSQFSFLGGYEEPSEWSAIMSDISQAMNIGQMVGSVVAAPFTGGASLALLPGQVDTASKF